MVSKRIQAIDSSGIRRVFDLASKMVDPINLSIGQPDFDASAELRAAAKAAIDQGLNRYTVTQGVSELRAAIATQHGVQLGYDKDILITSGVSGGLFLALMALLDPGDEILVPDPFFCMYRDLPIVINAVPVYYNCYPEFRIDAAGIETQITPKTQVLLVNSPANPTGVCITQAELDSVVELARKHSLWIIYDEIYSAFSYRQSHAVPPEYERLIRLDGFSKSHGITGWRVGYAIGSVDVIQQMAKLQQYTFVCAPSIAQYALANSWELPRAETLSNYRRKRDMVVDGLAGYYDFVEPDGAFYVFPKSPRGVAQEFVENCIKQNLLVVPGNVFSNQDTHFRISFAAPDEVLARGIAVLRTLA